MDKMTITPNINYGKHATPPPSHPHTEVKCTLLYHNNALLFSESDRNSPVSSPFPDLSIVKMLPSTSPHAEPSLPYRKR